MYSFEGCEYDQFTRSTCILESKRSSQDRAALGKKSLGYGIFLQCGQKM
jgi:hypothetical protein